MSLLSRASLALAVSLALTACGRETRNFSGKAQHSPNRGALYGGNAYEIAQGQRLFVWMNCAGCHSHGGGGMGPPLMDGEWRYGGSMRSIVTTILNGRPNGMPAFRDHITNQQAWELASYVRSLSARTREDALSGRAEEPSNLEPPTLDERKPVHHVSPEQDDASLPKQ